MEVKKEYVKLSSIDPVLTTNIPEYKEEKVRNKNYVSYGKDNLYPQYLWNLYNSVATLQSIINGTIDFVCGNDIKVNVPGFEDGILNKKGETILDIARKAELDNMIFGGFAFQVIRNMAGDVAEIYNVDMLRLRSDEKNEIFYYCDDWTK